MADAPVSRPNGRPHLSECLAFTAHEMGWDDPETYDCTCDDWSPEI